VTARQIIDEFRKLTPEEQVQVRAEIERSISVVTYANPADAAKAADQILTDRADLFRKLAQ
jgi:hypothetical protein